MKNRVFVSALLLVVSGCSTAPRPYPNLEPAGSAKLHVDETTAFYFYFMPDGNRCGRYLEFSPDQVPFVRRDRTMLLEPKKRSALQFVWVGKIDREFTCSAIVSFRVAPNGDYKLLTHSDGNICSANIIPLNDYSAQGFETRQMERTDSKLPSKCRAGNVR